MWDQTELMDAVSSPGHHFSIGWVNTLLEAGGTRSHYYHYIYGVVTSDPRSNEIDGPGEDLQLVRSPPSREDGDDIPVPELW